MYLFFALNGLAKCSSRRMEAIDILADNDTQRLRRRRICCGHLLLSAGYFICFIYFYFEHGWKKIICTSNRGTISSLNLRPLKLKNSSWLLTFRLVFREAIRILTHISKAIKISTLFPKCSRYFAFV